MSNGRKPNGLIDFICSECGAMYEDTRAGEPSLGTHTDEQCLETLKARKAIQVRDLARTDLAIATVIGRMRARLGDLGRRLDKVAPSS